VSVTAGSSPQVVRWELSCADGAYQLSGGAPFTGSIAVPPGTVCVLSMQAMAQYYGNSYLFGWSGAEWTGIGQQSLTLKQGLTSDSVTFVAPRS